MLAHAFNPSIEEANLCESKTSLVYKARFRTNRAIERNSISNLFPKQSKAKQSYQCQIIITVVFILGLIV